jgi:hypothetical protein
MSDNVTDPVDPTDPAPDAPAADAPVSDAPAADAAETLEQKFEVTVSAYGAALKDTLVTLQAVIGNAPGLVSALEADIQGLVDETKDKVTAFIEGIADDVESLIATGG